MVPRVLLGLVWNSAWLSMSTELVLYVYMYTLLLLIPRKGRPLMWAAEKGRTDVVEE